jgi:hypothetical protein
MKKFIYMLAAMSLVLSFTACDEGETYSEKKDKERDAIRAFIENQGISVISETQFHDQNNTTNTDKNEYAYMDNTGVYMQIVRPGCGTILQDGENATLKVRFVEDNLLLDNDSVLTNYLDAYTPDLMNITRTGNNFTASFTSGYMYSYYNASVPAGWLVPFNYIKLDRPTATDDIAMVRLIVPHAQGHGTASSNVYPYFYEITFQR